jgi:hypothetical protein
LALRAVNLLATFLAATQAGLILRSSPAEDRIRLVAEPGLILSYSLVKVLLLLVALGLTRKHFLVRGRAHRLADRELKGRELKGRGRAHRHPLMKSFLETENLLVRNKTGEFRVRA